jgi:hypothetical protein
MRRTFVQTFSYLLLGEIFSQAPSPFTMGRAFFLWETPLYGKMELSFLKSLPHGKGGML